ncbi:hypothetical protein ACFSZS_15950 [Seohaeicola zhoushanensis]
MGDLAVPQVFEKRAVIDRRDGAQGNDVLEPQNDQEGEYCKGDIGFVLVHPSPAVSCFLMLGVRFHLPSRGDMISVKISGREPSPCWLFGRGANGGRCSPDEWTDPVQVNAIEPS